MIELETEIKSLDRVKIVSMGNMIMRWCRNKFGVNKRKRWQPIWYIRKSLDDDEICGEYDATDNEVYIYYNNILDVKELIETCIHEWTHQNQPILTKYNKYPGTYSRNPYERQARYAEKKWTPVCWNELKNRINKVK